MDMKPTNWFTVRDTQEYVQKVNRHWSRTYIQYLINNKRLESFKIGAARLFLREKVDECLASLKRKGPPILVKKNA